MKTMLLQVLVIVLVGLSAFHSYAKTVEYDLTVTRENRAVMGGGPPTEMMLINKSWPAPTLYFTEGDEAVIRVHNKMDEDTTIHWHGILLPVGMDGVSPLSQLPIAAGATFTYRFPIRQAGTYWYHSHTMLQEQQGLYGGLVIYPKNKKLSYDKELVLVLSDFTYEHPHHVLANLKKDGDFYTWKKNTIPNWMDAFRAGRAATLLHNFWAKMPAMDLSDVGYDAFFINGQTGKVFDEYKKGDRILLRIINAAASTYFYLNIGQRNFDVVSADGIDIVPVPASELYMGMAETYDVIFQMSEAKSFEVRATAQDSTGFASLYLGAGEKESAPVRPAFDPYGHDMLMMSGGGSTTGHGAHDMSHMNHASMGHDMSHMNHADMGHDVSHKDTPMLAGVLTYDKLVATKSTEYDKNLKRHEFALELDGDMQRYIWWINGKMLSEDRSIIVDQGDVIRFRLVNKSMMSHPMHLHGHFFRVLNSQGESAPLKHTVDVPPFSERTIEFKADAPGEWFFHCHNLYHMKNGMGRVVSYQGYNRPPELGQYEKKTGLMMDDHVYFKGQLELFSNEGAASVALSRTWYDIEATINSGTDYKIEEGSGAFMLKRWLGKSINVQVGGEILSEHGNGLLGMGFILPMLVEADVLINNDGDPIFHLEHEAPLTKSLRLELGTTLRSGAAGDEWSVGLLYQFDWSTAVGIRFSENEIGVGGLWRF